MYHFNSTTCILYIYLAKVNYWKDQRVLAQETHEGLTSCPLASVAFLESGAEYMWLGHGTQPHGHLATVLQGKL